MAVIDEKVVRERSFFDSLDDTNVRVGELVERYFQLICSAEQAPSMDARKVADELHEKLQAIDTRFGVVWRDGPQPSYADPAPERRPICVVHGPGYEMALDVCGPNALQFSPRLMPTRHFRISEDPT